MNEHTPITQLGLSPPVLAICTRLALKSFEDLSGLSLPQLVSNFGKDGRMQMARVLRIARHVFPENPSNLELWRSGLIDRRDMRLPGSEKSVDELQPWIGTCVLHYHMAGFTTVGALQNAINAGKGRVRGVGDSTVRRVAAFLREEYADSRLLDHLCRK